MVSAISVVIKSGGVFGANKISQVCLTQEEQYALTAFIAKLHGGKIKVLEEAPVGINFLRIKKTTLGSSPKERIEFAKNTLERGEAIFKEQSERRGEQ